MKNRAVMDLLRTSDCHFGLLIAVDVTVDRSLIRSHGDNLSFKGESVNQLIYLLQVQEL